MTVRLATAPIIFRGNRQEIAQQANAMAAGAMTLFDPDAQPLVPYLKRQIDPFQGAALYALASTVDHPDSVILEVGTAWGYSASVMAMGARRARICTLNPKGSEVVRAREHLHPFRDRVTVIETTSDAFWQSYADLAERFDLVFIDGDHRPGPIKQDMRWFNRLVRGGMIVFHDYAPAGTPRPCPAVVETLNEIRDTQIKRDFDIQIIPDDGVGMVGWFRHPGDVYQYQE